VYTKIAGLAELNLCIHCIVLNYKTQPKLTFLRAALITWRLMADFVRMRIEDKIVKSRFDEDDARWFYLNWDILHTSELHDLANDKDSKAAMAKIRTKKRTRGSTFALMLAVAELSLIPFMRVLSFHVQ
jgi:hypothetical protein